MILTYTSTQDQASAVYQPSQSKHPRPRDGKCSAPLLMPPHPRDRDAAACTQHGATRHDTARHDKAGRTNTTHLGVAPHGLDLPYDADDAPYGFWYWYCEYEYW